MRCLWNLGVGLFQQPLPAWCSCLLLPAVPCLTGREVCGEPALPLPLWRKEVAVVLVFSWALRSWFPESKLWLMLVEEPTNQRRSCNWWAFSMLVCKDEYLLQLIATAPWPNCSNLCFYFWMCVDQLFSVLAKCPYVSPVFYKKAKQVCLVKVLPEHSRFLPRLYLQH